MKAISKFEHLGKDFTHVFCFLLNIEGLLFLGLRFIRKV